MKFQLAAITALLTSIAANPVPSQSNEVSVPLKPRLVETSNDLENGPCLPAFLIFARGTTEPGNMGEIIGPQLCSALQAELGSSTIGCQGVGSPYDAVVADNFLPQNTSPTDIGAATTLFDLAASKCPSSLIVAGGYSQGSAVMDGSIQALPSSIQSKIKGTVLFGFTRNEQDGGRIPNYPTSQTLVFCAAGDLVCDDTLTITPAHLSYGVDADPAATFLISKLGL